MANIRIIILIAAFTHMRDRAMLESNSSGI